MSPLPVGFPPVQVTPDAEHMVELWVRSVPSLCGNGQAPNPLGPLYLNPGNLNVATQLPANFRGSAFLTVTQVSTTAMYDEAPAVAALIQFSAFAAQQSGGGARADFRSASALIRLVVAAIQNIWGEPVHDLDGSYLGQVADGKPMRGPDRMTPVVPSGSQPSALAAFSFDALIHVIAPDNAAVSG